MPSRPKNSAPVKVRRTPPDKPTKRGPEPTPQADGDSRGIKSEGKSPASSGKGSTERHVWRFQLEQAELNGEASPRRKTKPRS
ncbi:MAG: hypothetical protein ACYC2K_13450 [Gemmatimonadales bacterium]